LISQTGKIDRLSARPGNGRDALASITRIVRVAGFSPGERCRKFDDPVLT
jgi:hypothetical protein